MGGNVQLKRIRRTCKEASSFANLVRRMGFGCAPHAPTDAEGDEQSHTSEDGRAEPQGNLYLMDVSLQPWFDADIGDGEGYHGRSHEHHQLLDEEEPQNVAHFGTEHLANGNFLAPLFALMVISE